MSIGVWVWLVLVAAALIVEVGYQFEWRRIQRRRTLARLPQVVAALDEKVLLGPVSAWVAEGEARAVREWEKREWQMRSTESRALHFPDGMEPPADISGIKMVEIP